MFDYLFLCSNAPTPTFLDKVRVAQGGGRRPLIVYFCRQGDYLAADLPAGCEAVGYPVKFEGVEMRRVWTLISFMRWLRRKIGGELTRGADCYTETFDMLLIAMLAGRGWRIRYRFEARDLHAVQFGVGPLSLGLRLAERLAIPRLHTLVLTSEKFWEEYYSRFRARRYVIVEHVPRIEVWRGFSRQPSGVVFRIGFVGMIRYYACLVALIDAVRQLRAEGCSVVVRFAGGGDQIRQLRAYCGDESWVEFSGPFRYTADIQRLYSDVDLIYSVYDTRFKNVRFAMPNKFYEAHIAKIPIMVASGTYLEDRVGMAGIGIGVPCLNATAIAAALRPALSQEGWYAEAQEKLNSNLLESYLEEHRSSILRAVLD